MLAARLTLAFLTLLATSALGEFRGDKTIVVSPELKVSIGEGDEITLSARPLPGEGLDAFVKRFTEDPRTKSEILSRNEGVKLLRKDVFVRVPYRLLSENYRRIAIEALFPGDTTDPQGWVHRVSALTGKPESLWRIAEWFTGDGLNYREIRAANGLESLGHRIGPGGPDSCEAAGGHVSRRGPGRGRDGARSRSSSAATRRGGTRSTTCSAARRSTPRSWSA